MNPDEEFSRTFADVCELYELALSSGQSLDLEDNCRRFLGTLMSRKGFASSEIWLRPELRPPDTAAQPSAAGLVLAYAVPRERHQPVDEPTIGKMWRQVNEQGAFSVMNADPAVGARAVFPLTGLGFLRLEAPRRREPLSSIEIAQLQTVINKFATSVAGCLDHDRVVRAEAERARAATERDAAQAQLQQAQK